MRTIKMTMSGAILMSCAFMLASCGPQGRSDTMSAPRNVPAENAVDEYDVERARIDADLLELRNKVDSRVDEVDGRLATEGVDDRRRADLIRYREDLQDRRNQIERARRDVDAARTDNWDNVKKATDNTLDDIGDWFNRQGDRIDTIFQDDDDLDDPFDD